MRISNNLIRLAVTLVLMGLMLPTIVSGSRNSLSTMFNAPPLWIPTSFEYRRQYDWFREHFTSEDTVVLSWMGCTIDDDRLEQFATALMSAPDAQKRYRNRQLFQRVVTGPGLLAAMTKKPLSLARRTALARITGVFVGSDGRTSCALVVLTQEGGFRRHQALRVIIDTAEEVCGLPQDQFFLAGAPVDGAVIDSTSTRAINRFAIPSAAVALLLCYWCLRSWMFTLVIVATAAFGEGLVLALVDWSGDSMNAILVVMPALIFVLTVSAGVHLANYYQAALPQHGGEDVVTLAMRSAWLPCLLAATTTVIGLGSLLVSEITPIRTFSLISSAGVITAVALLFLLLPGVMELDAMRRSATAHHGEEAPAGRGDRWLRWLANHVVRFPITIFAVFSVTMLLLGWGLVSLRTSVNVRALFSPESRIIRDYRWLEEHLGPLIPVEVIVQFGPDCELPSLQRMELVCSVQREITEMEPSSAAMSAATFFPEIPPADGILQRARRAVLRRRLDEHLGELVQTNYLLESSSGQSWRISARIAALRDLDYDEFLRNLSKRIDPILRESGDRGVSAIYTGSMPVAYEAQRALLHDLFFSFLTAFAFVAVVMVVVLRNLWAGVLAMLPNLFPALALFGLMGWLAAPIDIGAVMTVSVALGIAVDDTVHFLVWYRRETAGGTAPPEAVRNCFRHCGRAMTQTSLICGLGLLVYAFSDFVPTRQFACFILWLLLAALAGDLLLLPALLLGPFGKVFLSRPQAKPTRE